MTTNSLVLDPELTAQLGDCAAGDEKQVVLTITVDKHDDTGLSGTVTAVEPYDAAASDTTEGEPAAVANATPGMGSPAMKKAMAG